MGCFQHLRGTKEKEHTHVCMHARMPFCTHIHTWTHAPPQPLHAGRLSYRGSVLSHPSVQDTKQWSQVTGSQISVECQEKFPNCQSSTTVEPIASRAGECSNTGGIQEKRRQQSGRYPLICIPALSRGFGLDGLLGPFQLHASV